MSPSNLRSVSYFPNLLLLCGSGRDTGKTYLACNIINHWKKQGPVVAMKISMHKHMHTSGMELLLEKPGYSIWKEHTISKKDSGRFLEAGAKTVLYIETDDLHLHDAFLGSLIFIGKASMIVCESGGLAKIIRPGLILFVQPDGKEIDENKKPLRAMADKVIHTDCEEIHRPDTFLAFESNRWKFIGGNQGGV